MFLSSVYDSTGKQGAGVFSGALGWPGNLEQCLLTPDIYKKSGGFGSGDNLTSKFCSAFVEPPKWVKIWIEDSVITVFCFLFFSHFVLFLCIMPPP